MKLSDVVFTFIFLSVSLCVRSQVVNQALSLQPGGFVDCGRMPALDNLDSYSLQFWMCPQEWSEGAVILQRGDDFNVSLGNEGNLTISSSNSDLNVTSPSFKPGEWSQVTIICDKGETGVYINGEKIADGHLSPIEISKESFLIGSDYSGMIDEIRIWDAALNEEMRNFDYFTFNTLNKWCPQLNNLVAYYKIDEDNTPYILDYKKLESEEGRYNNHGIISPTGATRVEANNPKLPYLINGAYTNNVKFYEGAINRDQYLLSNNLIILGSDPFAEDGHIETKTPNNHSINIDNIIYLDEFEGRKGVVNFKGNPDSRIILPGKTLDSDADFTFESWVNIDKWQPDAYLFRKENTNNPKETALMLSGTEENPSLTFIINGKEYVSNSLPLKTGEWTHIAVSYSDAIPVFFVNGEVFEVNNVYNTNNTRPKNTEISSYIENADQPTLIFLGENLPGKLDETVFWQRPFGSEEIKSHKEEIPMPAIGKSVDRHVMSKARGFYKYNDRENSGYSSHSQDEWLKIMKEAYSGYDGVKFHISVQGTYKVREPYGDWREILRSPDKRKRFAEDLATISAPYDGVELDLEWLEKPEQWQLFGILCDEIRSALPEDKDFRVSLHNHYYQFPPEKMNVVDGFTFQQYGPNPRNFSYEYFLENVDKFINFYDRDKILTSYATTTSKGENGEPVNGIWAFMEDYKPSDADIDTFSNGEVTWRYIGPMQTYRRAKHTREKNLGGIFYWDMANDTRPVFTPGSPQPPLNEAVYCSFGINANLHPDTEGILPNHYPK